MKKQSLVGQRIDNKRMSYNEYQNKRFEAFTNARLQKEARFINDANAGIKIDIDTLTHIFRKVVKQKKYKIPFADYVPVTVGEGAWQQTITTYTSFNPSGSFFDGITDIGSGDARKPQVETQVKSVDVKVFNWAKEVKWTLMELFHSQAGRTQWDIVEAKALARKENWDLGLQEVAFLGHPTDKRCLGLLTQAITPDTTLLTNGEISTLTHEQLNSFASAAVEAYRVRTNRTEWPTHFGVPESEHNKLVGFTNSQFPILTKKGQLERAFQDATGNKQFKVVSNAYADPDHTNGRLTKKRYYFMNMDESSIRMDIPVDFNSTIASSMDNFTFQNVAYGQFTGVMLYRPNELMYLQTP